MEALAGVEEFKSFITGLIDRKPRKYSEVIVPARAPDGTAGSGFLARLEPGMDFQLEGHRTADPVKALLYLFRERVSGPAAQRGERIIAGIKSCDINGLILLDRAMINDDYTDPAYADWRSRTTIISSDCTSTDSTCHCNLTGGEPWAESGYDLNLSRVGNEFLISTGSKKGEVFLEMARGSLELRDVEPAIIKRVREKRSSMKDTLDNQNGGRGYQEIAEFIRSVEPGVWREASAGCIGCGACTNICPTCYCLILNDESSEKEFIKERSYDSCQLAGYARVAGGGTPRPLMTDRFRNRYVCKLALMERNHQVFGCTGCGRCIEACPAGIDIRNVVSGINRIGRPGTVPGSEKEIYQGREV